MHKINGLNYLCKQIVVNNNVRDDLNAIDAGVSDETKRKKQCIQKYYRNAQSELSSVNFFFTRLTKQKKKHKQLGMNNTNDYSILYF